MVEEHVELGCCRDHCLTDNIVSELSALLLEMQPLLRTQFLDCATKRQARREIIHLLEAGLRDYFRFVVRPGVRLRYSASDPVAQASQPQFFTC
jgi:hypothetical protein